MTPNLDRYRSPNVLVKQHGEAAPVEATMRADAMLEKGDLDGYSVWKGILKAVDLGEQTTEGHIIQAITVPWLRTVQEVECKPCGVGGVAVWSGGSATFRPPHRAFCSSVGCHLFRTRFRSRSRSRAFCSSVLFAQRRRPRARSRAF